MVVVNVLGTEIVHFSVFGSIVGVAPSFLLPQYTVLYVNVKGVLCNVFQCKHHYLCQVQGYQAMYKVNDEPHGNIARTCKGSFILNKMVRRLYSLCKCGNWCRCSS